jgi:hypothetical protein
LGSGFGQEGSGSNWGKPAAAANPALQAKTIRTLLLIGPPFSDQQSAISFQQSAIGNQLSAKAGIGLS